MCSANSYWQVNDSNGQTKQQTNPESPKTTVQQPTNQLICNPTTIEGGDFSDIQSKKQTQTKFRDILINRPGVAGAVLQTPFPPNLQDVINHKPQELVK